MKAEGKDARTVSDGSGDVVWLSDGFCSRSVAGVFTVRSGCLSAGTAEGIGVSFSGSAVSDTVSVTWTTTGSSVIVGCVVVGSVAAVVVEEVSFCTDPVEASA